MAPLGIWVVAVADAGQVLDRSVLGTWFEDVCTDLILGKESVADAGEQHHGYQEGDECLVERHLDGERAAMLSVRMKEAAVSFTYNYEVYNHPS